MPKITKVAGVDEVGRGCLAGGRDSGSSNQADIGFIEIATKGDAINFGDLATGRRVYSSLCDAHGGLG